jgi:hypothetical protein
MENGGLTMSNLSDRIVLLLRSEALRMLWHR